MAPQMKGLHQFITDLRNANDSTEEVKRINMEINNIKTKYASGNLDSYQKRKYLCKLLYIHLLGMTEEAHMGLDQAFNLLLAPTASYQEKSLGYMAISMLYAPKHGSKLAYILGLIEKTHVFLLRDLNSNSDDTNILALQFIASTLNVAASPSSIYVLSEVESFTDADAQAENFQRLIEMVYGLCVSPISTSTVKMRALVSLLVMSKAYPQFLLVNDNWFPRLLSLLDERDLGVVTCTVPLVRYLTGLKPKYAKSIVPQIAALLYSLLVDELCPSHYLYYGVPAPWLIIKLFQLLEHLFVLCPAHGLVPLDVANLDHETLAKLRQSVSKSIQNASTPVKGQSDRNSRTSVLFEAVSIAPFLDASPEAIQGATHALALLLSTPETNMRYLVLDALIKICIRSQYLAVFEDYLEDIMSLLRDRDVSVRKKSLDLLFTICDGQTYTQITNCFLEYFPHAEQTLKSDILVKIAVLAERFATDSIWYVSTMIRLLSIGGQSSKTVAGVDGTSHAGEVWERIIQIIVNNEEIQKMAIKYVINILRKSEQEPSENIIKVAAFILGEFGHKLADAEDPNGHFGVANQFYILSSSYLASSILVRPLVMNALLKFVLKFPDEDFIPDIIDLFDAETRSLDLEIQTRAHEYLRVATLLTSGSDADISLAKSLIQPLPPFESRQNKLIGQLGSLKMIAGPSLSSLNVSKIPPRHIGDINGIARGALTSPVSGEPKDADPFGDHSSQQDKVPQLSPNWYEGYHRMLQFDAGIFYEDQLVKLTYRIVREGATYKIVFTIINNAAKTADASITAFTVHDVHTMGSSQYLVSLSRLPESKIPQKTVMELDVKVRDIIGNKEGPVIAMSFKCSGSFNTLALKIPVALTKTLSGTSMKSIDEFKKRWLQIGEMLGLENGEKRGIVTATYRRSSSTVVKMLQRLGFAIIQSTPDEPNSNILVMGAGILRMVKSNCGVLVTMKTLRPDSNDFDVIVRSTGVGVPAIVFDTIRELLDLKH